MSSEAARGAVLRSLCLFGALGHAPTTAEAVAAGDVGSAAEGITEATAWEALEALVASGVVAAARGRIGLVSHFSAALERADEADFFFPRKWRKAKRVAAWLARLPTVRFVALANTTAWGMARDEGDLDFFVVAEKESIWRTRIAAVAPFIATRQLPGQRASERDAVCLSYFVADNALDLSAYCLDGDDPYVRHWFLALLPLFDDGIGAAFWDANAGLRRRHPLARPWALAEGAISRPPHFRVPLPRFLERPSEIVQRRWFPATIREAMNHDSRVRVSDDVLKFHVDDGRAKYRERYFELCRTYGIAP